MLNAPLSIIALLFLAAGAVSAEEGKHLFILSGQSNMAGLKPEESFTPTLEKKFGKERVLVVFDAHGGQPMRRWYRDWKPTEGPKPEKNGDLYDRLMGKVKAAIQGEDLATVTFLWMQGERDAKEGHGSVYEASMKGLVNQVSEDLGGKDVNVVIGRLSDFGLKKPGYKDWDIVRKAQMKVAGDAAKGAWVDTDDLNDGKNRGGKEIKDDLHYSKDGYVIFGQRLADAAIRLIGG
ncbi:acetyl xylan esterase [Akkermansiaceae bacterium]|nr:acetyl xylan esterase [Akkermansiaceae bacterium]